eukprot:4626771-Pyramimonas_sp.AAC.1
MRIYPRFLRLIGLSWWSSGGCGLRGHARVHKAVPPPTAEGVGRQRAGQPIHPSNPAPESFTPVPGELLTASSPTVVHWCLGSWSHPLWIRPGYQNPLGTPNGAPSSWDS